MSRTFKDRPAKLIWPEQQWDFNRVTYTGMRWDIDHKYEYVEYSYMQLPGKKTKKKRHVDTEWNWMTTPMWWIREMMNRPQRAKGRQWEHKTMKVAMDDLDTVDHPSVSRKPHMYYW